MSTLEKQYVSSLSDEALQSKDNVIVDIVNENEIATTLPKKPSTNDFATLREILLGKEYDDLIAFKENLTITDIGKIAVKDKILLKKRQLSKDEFKEIQQHTIEGYNMLKNANIAVLDMAAEIALCHHEKWDGTGYPYGISRNQYS